MTFWLDQDTVSTFWEDENQDPLAGLLLNLNQVTDGDDEGLLLFEYEEGAQSFAVAIQ